MMFTVLTYILDRFVTCQSRKSTCMMNNLGPEVNNKPKVTSPFFLALM